MASQCQPAGINTLLTNLHLLFSCKHAAYNKIRNVVYLTCSCMSHLWLCVLACRWSRKRPYWEEHLICLWTKQEKASYMDRHEQSTTHLVTHTVHKTTQSGFNKPTHIWLRIHTSIHWQAWTIKCIPTDTLHTHMHTHWARRGGQHNTTHHTTQPTLQ